MSVDCSRITESSTVIVGSNWNAARNASETPAAVRAGQVSTRQKTKASRPAIKTATPKRARGQTARRAALTACARREGGERVQLWRSWDVPAPSVRGPRILRYLSLIHI